MDPAVGLVEAYLQINGYLTVAEYPIFAEADRGSESVTDIDVIALRFPGARRLGSTAIEPAEPDRALQASPDA